MTFSVASKHLQTERFCESLRAYFMEVQRMLKEIHRESNRRPNLTFVDHHQGQSLHCHCF